MTNLAIFAENEPTPLLKKSRKHGLANTPFFTLSMGYGTHSMFGNCDREWDSVMKIMAIKLPPTLKRRKETAMLAKDIMTTKVEFVSDIQDRAGWSILSIALNPKAEKHEKKECNCLNQF